MVLHDQLVLQALGRDVDDALVEQLRLINAALNVACFSGWAIWAAVRTPTNAAETPISASKLPAAFVGTNV